MADNKAQGLMDEVKKVLNEYNGISAEYVDIYGEDSGANETDKERFKDTHYVMSTDSDDCHKITAINKDDGSVYVEIDGKEITTADDLMTALPKNIALREIIAEQTGIDLYAHLTEQWQNYSQKWYERDKDTGMPTCCIQFKDPAKSSEKICELYSAMIKRGLTPHDFQLSDNEHASAYMVLPNVYARGDLNDGSKMEFRKMLIELATNPEFADFEIVSKADTSYEQYKAESLDKAVQELLDPEKNPRALYDIIDKLNKDGYFDKRENQDSQKITADNPAINRDSLLHMFAALDSEQIKDTAILNALQAAYHISDSEIEKSQLQYLRRGGYDAWKDNKQKAIAFALQDEDYIKFTVSSLMQAQEHGDVLDKELSDILKQLDEDFVQVLSDSLSHIETEKPYLKSLEQVYEFDTSCAEVREALKEKLKDPKTLMHTQSYEEQHAGEQAIKMLENIIRTETEEINSKAPAKDSKFKPIPTFKPLDPPNIDVYLAKAAALYEKENKLGITAIKFEDKFKDVIQNARTLQNTQNQNYRFKERVLHFVQKMADKDSAKLFYDNMENKMQEMLCKSPKLLDKSVELVSDVAKKLYEGFTPPAIQKGLEPVAGVSDKITEKAQEAVSNLTDKVSEALVISHKKAQEDHVQHKVNEAIKNSLVKLTNHAAHLALKIAKRDQTRVPVNGSLDEIRQAHENIRMVQSEHTRIDAGAESAKKAPLGRVVSWSKNVAKELAETTKAAYTATREATKTLTSTFKEAKSTAKEHRSNEHDSLAG